MRILILALIASIVPAVPAGAVSPEWANRWRADLTFLRDRLPKVHPSPFEHVSAAEVDATLSVLERRLPHLSHGEITTELARIVAMLRDGHTRLTWPLPAGTDFVLGHARTDPPSDPSLLMRTFPIRFGVYADGVFVERVTAEHERVLGAQLVGIGRLSTAEAIGRMQEVIAHDNRSQLLDLLPLHLVLAEALHARGVTGAADRASFRLRRDDGSEQEVLLNAGSGSVDWVGITSSSDRRPLSWSRLLPGKTPGRGAFSERHWYEWLPEKKMLYVQLSESYDDPDESLFDFAARLQRFLQANPVQALVLDLRHNFGGDNTLNQPLLHALISSPVLHRAGGLRVLIGRGTFSAAMMLAVDLEKHLRPIFIGEPSGSKPNAFGDSRRIVLPESGLTIRISTLYWQYGGPHDRRSAIAPHIELPPSWEAVRGRRDEALQVAISRTSLPSPLPRAWNGRMTLGTSEVPVSLTIDAAARTGEVSLGGVAEGLKLSLVDQDEHRLSFVTTLEGKSLSFEATGLRGYLAGHALFDDRRGNPFPFAIAPE
jgi:hypothetical protein